MRELAGDVYALLALGQERRVAAVITAIRHDADLEALLIDRKIVRAHQRAAGAPKETARKHSGTRGAG